MKTTVTLTEHDRRVGELVAKARKEKGLQQDDLADRLGWSRSFISHIEQGKRRVPLDSVFPLSRALGVEPEAIMPPDAPHDEVEALRLLAMLPQKKRRLAIAALKAFVQGVVIRGEGEFGGQGDEDT